MPFYSALTARLWFACLLLLVATAKGAIEHPRIQWAVQTDGPIRGSAVVAGEDLFFGSADGHVYAVTQADGDLRWKFSTGGTIAGAPAVNDALVIVSGRSDRVFALDRRDGSVRWTFQMQPTSPAVIDWNFFTAAPVIADDLVLVPSGDGQLYALTLATGERRWQFATGDSLRAAPLVADGVVYQPSGDDHVYALSLADGALRWKFATAGVGYDLSQGFIRSDIFTQPCLQDGILVIGSRDGNVYGLDAATGEKRWTFSYGSTWAMAVAIDSGLVYVGWSTNNKINALDLQSGKQVWEFDAGSHTYAAPAIVGDRSYWASAAGRLHCLDKRTGERLWSYALGSDLYSPPVHRNGTLYLGTDDGRLLAVADGAAAVHKAVYVPAAVPDSLRGFVVSPQLAPYLVEHGYTLLDSPAALEAWVTARTAEPAPSVVVFGYALIPNGLIGEQPSTGPLRAYLASGGKVVWAWGHPNKYAFDEAGKFVAHEPAVGAKLLGLRFVDHQDSGNYFSRSTQTGRNWGLPTWLKATFAYLQPDSDVTALAHDEYGRVNVWVKSFHARSTSGWVNYGPTGYGTPMTAEELATLERVASYGVE